ncbi:efflux RND transporter periplasmic adaptor subunit [Leptolyngbya sp. AN02str]|uniref:efflux RND transporter periplasmic adaptor subunit n=1 Tax=Leptolyngbya sp. AN02str TaxID=3423363 RepID=UPI003D319B46
MRQQKQHIGRNIRRNIGLMSLAASVLLVQGCQVLPQSEAQAQAPQAGEAAGPRTVSVETAIAQTGSLREDSTYTGTTQPLKIVSVRAQTEGRVVNLTADVGDRVSRGQVLGQLDDRLLATSLSQEQAELAALESGVAQAQTEVSDAEAQVVSAQLQLQQAIADAERLQSLADQGVVTRQQAEQAQTARLTAEQVVKSAQEQVRTRQQAVVAAQRRVAAQQAAVSEVGQRRAYAALAAPASGAVLERMKQPGDLAQPGEEILTIGDFSNVKVVVQLSELELGKVQVGLPAQVTLDAFPNRTFSGVVERISPAADPTARLIPVEVVIPNQDGRVSSGLLARVQFRAVGASRIVIPETALEAAEDSDSTVFVVQGEGENATVSARSVTLGDRANGRVEVLSGLQPGETVVVRSGRPLEDGQTVRLSILSEQSPSSSSPGQPLAN